MSNNMWLRRSSVVKFLPSMVVVVAILVVLLVFEPPKDVEARLGRPYISAVNPCQQSDLLTVDVADERYISRLRVGESFAGAPTELPEVRVQSVEDGESNIYVLKTELQTGVVEAVVFDSDGFPIVASPDGISEVTQLRMFVSIPRYMSTSEPVLIPTSAGFYFFAQLENGNVQVVRISLDSTGRRFAPPKSIVLRDFDLSGVRPGFAVALADQIVIATSQETVARIRSRSGDSELERLDLKIPGVSSEFLGRPLLTSTGSDVFALISTRTNEEPTLISLSAGGKSEFDTLDADETKLLTGYEVIAASPRPSDYGVFLLRQTKTGASESSHLSAFIANDGSLRTSQVKISNSSNPVTVLGHPGVVMVVGSTKSTGELSYQVNRSKLSSAVSSSAVSETVLIPQQGGCIERTVGSLNPDQNSASNQWLELVAIRAATPIVQGGFLFLSGPFSTYDCVIREDEIGIIDLGIHCASGGGGYVEKEAAPAVDLVDGLLKIAVASAERTKSVTTTTLPSGDGAEQIDLPPESPASVTVENLDCALGSEVPRAPNLVGKNSGGSRISQRSGRSKMDVVLQVFKSGSTSCYPDEVEITVCLMDTSNEKCEDTRKQKFDIRDRGDELGVPFLIENVQGRDGRINRVTSVAIRNSVPSEESDAIEVDMEGELLCQPRGVQAALSPAEETWSVSWDLGATKSDCEDVIPSKYVVEVLKCTPNGRAEFLARVDGVYKDSVMIKAFNDALVDRKNLRGQSVSFQVLSVADDTSKKLSPGRSSPTQCSETTTTALARVELSSIGLTANAVKAERKLQVKGTADQGGLNYLALTRSLGTSNFQLLCLSWQLNSASVGEELCVSNQDLQDWSRPLALDFRKIGCVKGTWQLLFVPRGPAITTRKHNFSVPIEIECSFVFNGLDSPQIEVFQPVKNGALTPQQWSIAATVAGLGYDIEELGSDLDVVARLSCDLWNGEPNREYNPIGGGSRVTPIVSTKKEGAADFTLAFESLPRIRKLKDGCHLIVEATPPGALLVGGRWPVDLSAIAGAIADEIAIEVGETVSNNMKSIDFDRKFAEGNYTTTITARDSISCPFVGTETDFTVTITIGGGNPIPCAKTTDLVWSALSVKANDPATTLSTVELIVDVTSQSGSISKTQVLDLTKTACSISASELNNPCDDPRIPMIERIEIALVDSGDVIFTVSSDKLNLTSELTGCRVKTVSGDLLECLSKEANNPESQNFQFQGLTPGDSLWLRLGVKSPNISSSVVVQVKVPSPVIP